MLISDIRDEFIREIGGDLNDSTLQTLVLQLIKNILRRFPRYFSDKAVMTVKSGTLSSGATTMTRPSGIVRIRDHGVYYQTSDNQRIEIENKPSLWEFNQDYRGNDSGAPIFYREYGTTIEFNRKADQAYTVYFECYQEIDNVALTDTWSYTTDLVEVLKDGVKWLYAEDYTENEEGNASAKRERFSAGVEQIKINFADQHIPSYVIEA